MKLRITNYKIKNFSSYAYKIKNFASYAYKLRNFQRGFIKFTKRALVSYLIVSIVFLGTGLIYLFNPFTTGSAEAAWFNDNWGYRKNIPITAHTAVETNEYISVTIADTDDLVTAGQLQSDCDDMRFTKQNGDLMPYYIVSGCNSVSTVVHIYFDSFPAGAQTLYFYYGNPSTIAGGETADFSTEASNYTVGSIGSEEKGSSPVAYWKFDDAQGTTAQDSSINNNDGTLNTSPVWTTDDMCISDKCLRFNQTSDQSVSIPSSTSLLPTYITISVWVKFNAANYNARIIDQNSEDFLLNLESDDIATGTKKIRFVTNFGHAIESNSGVPLNEWLQVVATYDGSTSKMFINGIQQADTSSWSGTINQNADTIYLGNMANGSNALNGYLDEFRVYNFALTDAQIKANYNARSNPEGVAQQSANNQNMPDILSNGLVGYWKTDESSGNASDSSGNALTLTNNNTATYTAGKFANAGTFSAASSQYLSTATTINDVKSVAFWTYNASTTDDYVSLTSGAYITSSSGTVSATGFTAPSIYVNGVLNGTLTAGTWQHIVITTSTAINANQFEIGRANSSYNNGKIDETRLYNRQLTPAEVSGLYNWAPGPIGYWKIDEGSGTDVTDSSGYGNNGTSNSGISRIDGKYNKAASFNGTTGNIQAGTSSSFDFGSSNFAIEMWVKFDTIQTQILAEKFTETGGPGWSWYMANSTQLVFYGCGDVSCGSFTKSSAFVTGQWYYLAITRNGSTFTTYVDGISIGTTTNADALTSSANPLTFGERDPSSGTQTFRLAGSIDDARIYNYARTSAQIIEDMNAGHPAPGSPIGTPLGYWKLDEGYSTTANNYGNGGSTLAGTFGGITQSSLSGWTNNGKFGKAVNFNGVSASTDDRINFGSDSSVDDLTDTGKSMTISSWIYPLTEGENNLGVIMSKNGNSSNPSNGWLFEMSSTATLRFSVDYSGTDLNVVAANNSVTLNQWQHVAMTYDGSGLASGVHIYVNGKEVSYQTQTNSSGTRASDASNSLLAGNNNTGGTSNTFNGTLDELKLYLQQLTPAQIGIDMNRSASQVLGAAGTSSTAGNDNASTRTAQSAASQYCIPGDSATCSPPQAEWKFDEGSGSTANDTSGNGNSATLSGPTFNNGKFNKSLSFNGSSDYATGPSTLEPDTAISVSAWVKVTGGSGAFRQIVSKPCCGTWGNPYALWDLRINDSNKASFGIARIVSPTLLTADGTTNVTADNKWHLITGTYDGSTIRVYLDGRLEGSTSLSQAISTSGAESIAIGTRHTTSGQRGEYFVGGIDQVQIFDYARTPAQIAWDYNKGAPIAHWKMDECQGTTINDMSGNGKTGTLTNATPGTCTSSGAWFDGVTGKRNYSIALDGTDDYIDLGSVSYGLQTGDAPFAIAAWVRPSATRNDGCVFSYGGASANQVISLCSDGSGNIYSVHYSNDHSYSTAWSLNVWQHVIISYDPATSTETLYVNGQARETWNPSNLDLQSSATSEIGRASWNSTYLNSALVDDVKLYNYYLTPTRAKSIYNEGAIRYGPVTGAP